MLNNAPIIRQLTEDQKIRLLTDLHTAEEPELVAMGLPRMRWKTASEGAGDLLPAPSALARSWDESLMAEATEAACGALLSEGVDHVLTVGAKPRLTPFGGGYSEDPYLAAHLAQASAKGAASAGVSFSPDGYGFTASERVALGGAPTPRFTRDFLEVPYSRLAAEGACNGIVTESGTAAPLGGAFGVTLCRRTDGAETVTALANGLICLAGSEEAVRSALRNYRRIKTAIRLGKATAAELETACERGEALSEEALDAAVDRLLDFMSACERRADSADTSRREAGDIGRRTALASTVLLENRRPTPHGSATLPLTAPTRVAVVGSVALEDHFALGELTDILTAAGHTVVGTARGYHPAVSRDDELTAEAMALAELADTVLLFVGTSPADESRMERTGKPVLPPSQRALCDRLSRSGKTVILILSTRIALDLSFLTRAAHPFGAVLLASVDQRDGLWAVAKVLTGAENPSGRLPVTLCAHDDPSDLCHTRRRVGPFVGYRYYDTVDCGYLYPFGHGLSYTSFHYSALREENGNIVFTVKNTGNVAGMETAQVYMGVESPHTLHPRKELIGYVRVALAPGEQTTVTLPVGVYVGEKEPISFERGRYTVYVGASVADIRLKCTFKGGFDTPPPDGEDPSDYLPTVSNIQTKRYGMEAESTPMKPSLRNLIFGIAALCLAVSLKLYEILTSADSVFLNVVAGILAVGAAVIFGMELLERRKQAAAARTELEEANAELFSDAATIPMPSASELFADELYVPAEDPADDDGEADGEEELYDSFSDVDKTLTLTDAASDLQALGGELGLLLSEETVGSLLAALASTRLLLVRDMEEGRFRTLVSLLGKYFGGAATVDAVGDDLRTEADLLYAESEDGERTPRGLLSALETAARERGCMSFAALTGVEPAELAEYAMPLARYAHAPHSGCALTAKDVAGENTLVRIPENMWFLLRLKEGASLCELPAYLTEAATVNAWTVELTAPATETREEHRPFRYGQMEYLCDRLRSNVAVEEDTWRRIDRLEAYAARYSDFRIGNKLALGLEMYMAALLEQGISEPIARDAALSACLMPSLIPALSGKLPRDERGLCETLDALLGDGNTTLCRETVKASGADLI